MFSCAIYICTLRQQHTTKGILQLRPPSTSGNPHGARALQASREDRDRNTVPLSTGPPSLQTGRHMPHPNLPLAPTTTNPALHAAAHVTGVRECASSAVGAPTNTIRISPDAPSARSAAAHTRYRGCEPIVSSGRDITNEALTRRILHEGRRGEGTRESPRHRKVLECAKRDAHCGAPVRDCLPHGLLADRRRCEARCPRWRQAVAPRRRRSAHSCRALAHHANALLFEVTESLVPVEGRVTTAPHQSPCESKAVLPWF